jgi:chromate transporter
MITPVVITAGFIGYLAAGLLGALLAAAGTFAPPFLVVVLAARWLRKPGPRVKAFVRGVTASATGAIAGAAFVLGKRAVFDVSTAAIALVALVVLFRAKRIPEPLVIASGWGRAGGEVASPRVIRISRSLQPASRASERGPV